jgi:hypothetical protein
VSTFTALPLDARDAYNLARNSFTTSFVDEGSERDQRIRYAHEGADEQGRGGGEDRMRLPRFRCRNLGHRGRLRSLHFRRWQD